MDGKNEEKIDNQFIDEMNRHLLRLDEECRDLSMICQVAKSFSGSNPALVAEDLACTVVDRLNAKRAVVLLANYTNSQPTQSNSPTDVVLDSSTVPSVPPVVDNFTCIFGLGVSQEDIEAIKYVPQQGILWQFIRSGEPFSVVGFGGRPLYQSILQAAGLDQLALSFWVPLLNRDNDHVIGIICVDSSTQSTSQTKFLNVFAPLAARALHNALVFQELKESKAHLSRQMNKLKMLYDVGRALSVVDNRNYLLTQILGHAANIAKAKKGSIMLFDDANEKLVVQVVCGIGYDMEQKILKGEVETTVLRRGEGIAGKVALTGKPIVVNNVSRDPSDFVMSAKSKVSSILCVPLVVHKDVIGVLNITNKLDGEGFTDDDLQIIEQVADQAAVAIHNSRLYELAVTDGLTKVYIRRHLFQRLSEELKRASRYNSPITVIMVDIDHFKNVNDTLGHPCGDKVLTEVARILKQSVREIDLIGRYGGEEFCVVLPNTTITGGLRVAHRMHGLLEELDIEWEGHPVRVAVSGGLSNFPEHASSLTDLIRCADAALYYSKRHGRNKTTVYNAKQFNITENML